MNKKSFSLVSFYPYYAFSNIFVTVEVRNVLVKGMKEMIKKNSDWAKQFEAEKLADELEEAELDKKYALKAMNSRKSIAPVHIYRILVEKTSPECHMTQTELSNILNKKYEIQVERKALARHIHTLEDEGLGIRSSQKKGVWYDPAAAWE